MILIMLVLVDGRSCGNGTGGCFTITFGRVASGVRFATRPVTAAARSGLRTGHQALYGHNLANTAPYVNPFVRSTPVQLGPHAWVPNVGTYPVPTPAPGPRSGTAFSRQWS